MDGICRKTTLHAAGTETQNVDSVETGFTAEVDLIAAWYSVIKNCVPRENRFPFQGNAVTVNRI
jgi:hypothetical protein